MDNEVFQEFIADQFAKMFKEFEGLKSEFGGLKSEFGGLKSEFGGLKSEFGGLKTDFDGLRTELKGDIVRLENKFDKQITLLHDFKVGQDEANQENKDAHITINTKIEELQLETAHIRMVK